MAKIKFYSNTANVFFGKNLAFPLRSANFPQIYADVPADTRRFCGHLRGHLRKSAGKKHTLIKTFPSHSPDYLFANCPQAASISLPRLLRTVTVTSWLAK